MDTINCQTCARGSKNTPKVVCCAHQNYHMACTFVRTFDAILYLSKCSCAPISNFTTVPYRWQREGRNLKPRIFGNFCRNSPPFLAHRVATIAKIRQFLDGIWTVVQECFLPVLHCLSAAMHLFSSCRLFSVSI